MEYRILGPLEVVDAGRELSLGGARQRALLAILLLHANEVVSSDRLVEELWGASPPESGRKALQVVVSHLRKTLLAASGENGVLVTRAPGYVLHVEEGELDSGRFEVLVEEARREPDAETRAATLREALALWRGEPLADLAYEPFAQPAIAHLEESRLAAVEERIEADLQAGRAGDLVGELEALVARHPLRERLRGQLMLALYRAGRQADALAVYQDSRRTLVDELGVEPGPELQALQKAVLEHDPALGRARHPRVSSPPGGPVPVRRRLPLALATLALLLLLAAAGAVGLTRGESPPTPESAAEELAAIVLASDEGPGNTRYRDAAIGLAAVEEVLSQETSRLSVARLAGEGSGFMNARLQPFAKGDENIPDSAVYASAGFIYDNDEHADRAFRALVADLRGRREGDRETTQTLVAGLGDEAAHLEGGMILSASPAIVNIWRTGNIILIAAGQPGLPEDMDGIPLAVRRLAQDMDARAKGPRAG